MIMLAALWITLQSVSCSVKLQDTSLGGLQTAQVEFFENRAENVNPSLSQLFTEDLKSRIANETRLSIEDSEADCGFSGFFSEYRITPVAPGAGEVSSVNRLTITVNVQYVNRETESQSFEQAFSAYADFDSNLSFSSQEERLVEEITSELIDKVFKKAFVNW